jgi:hypothetical protein
MFEIQCKIKHKGIKTQRKCFLFNFPKYLQHGAGAFFFLCLSVGFFAAYCLLPLFTLRYNPPSAKADTLFTKGDKPNRLLSAV